MYKPGQLITIGIFVYRIVRYPKNPFGHCANCDLFKTNVFSCRRYCYRRHNNNDFNKYPYGYVLKRVHPKSQEG